jgi:flagellar L-ring protein precursor FlgH
MRVTAVAAAVAVGLAVGAAGADSIWQRAGVAAQAPQSDVTAHQVGDTLTIVVNERSVINNGQERKLSKDSERNVNTGGTIDLGTIGGGLNKNVFDVAKIAATGKATSSLDGQANYQNDRQVTDSVTVTVEDVLPNGNLVVIGWRQRDIDGDKEIIQLSGIVRPSDIDFLNNVRSDQIADFRLVYKYKGRETDFTKPGWFDQVMNTLNPF